MDNKLNVITNLFEGKEIRSVWDSNKEDYYFSVVDVVSVLTDSSEPRKYWSVLKTRLKKEGSEVTTKCSQLKMMSPDGKIRLRDNMTDLEVAITNIGELATREIAKNEKLIGLNENRKAAKRGGGVVKKTKDFFEEETGSIVVTQNNFLNYQYDDQLNSIDYIKKINYSFRFISMLYYI